MRRTMRPAWIWIVMIAFAGCTNPTPGHDGTPDGPTTEPTEPFDWRDGRCFDPENGTYAGSLVDRSCYLNATYHLVFSPYVGIMAFGLMLDSDYSETAPGRFPTLYIQDRMDL